MAEDKRYIAIDLKSFYASVECVERGLDPMDAMLLVADPSRTEKTICLAVSPALKSYGISGRARLFEAIAAVRSANAKRRSASPTGALYGSSRSAAELERDPTTAIDYHTAVPRMALYVEYSARIYNVYLRYVAPEDIHVYSIDEVFIDATSYLKLHRTDAQSFARMLIKEVYRETGIPAAGGIGTNLYLCKVAMDIMAKHAEPDESGVRVAYLDEMSYREKLWCHRPLTDFWRIGHGYAEKLEAKGIYTMGDIAACSLRGEREYPNEELLYKLFGVNAELLIDHAWGYESCDIKDIKEYKPSENSLSSGQVLHCPYDFAGARLILREMTDMLVLDAVDKGLCAGRITVTVGYDTESLNGSGYSGQVVTDHYGRKIPKHAHGTESFDTPTSSTKKITEAAMKIYERTVDSRLLVRRITVTLCALMPEGSASADPRAGQIDIFSVLEDRTEAEEKARREEQRERKIQHTVLDIKKKFGKNAIIKGMNLEEGATAVERNGQIGGHKA